MVACLPADPFDWEYHVVTEVFVRSLERWIILDASFGVLPAIGDRLLGLEEWRSALRDGVWNARGAYGAYMTKNVFMFMCDVDRRYGGGDRVAETCLLCPRGYQGAVRGVRRYRKSYVTSNSGEFWRPPR